MRVRTVGADALLLEVDDPAAWFAELWHRRDTGQLAVAEIIPGARTVLLDGLADPTGAAEAIRSLDPGANALPVPAPALAPMVEIAVDYGGVDLPLVARYWQTDADGVVERLSGTVLRVAFCGFSPGFAYLSGLPAELAVPRLDTPRQRVPAGSVALADTYAGIYPSASPGGWLLVGQTDAVMFDPERRPPALLTPGTRVRLAVRSRP